KHIGFARREFLIAFVIAIDIRRLDVIERKVMVLLKTKFGHPPEKIFIMWGLSGLHTDEANAQHFALLSARHERQDRRATDQRDKLAPPQAEHTASLLQSSGAGNHDRQ